MESIAPTAGFEPTPLALRATLHHLGVMVDAITIFMPGCLPERLMQITTIYDSSVYSTLLSLEIHFILKGYLGDIRSANLILTHM